MIIEIALGIVLAVIIIALWPILLAIALIGLVVLLCIIGYEYLAENIVDIVYLLMGILFSIGLLALFIYLLDTLKNHIYYKKFRVIVWPQENKVKIQNIYFVFTGLGTMHDVESRFFKIIHKEKESYNIVLKGKTDSKEVYQYTKKRKTNEKSLFNRIIAFINARICH